MRATIKNYMDAVKQRREEEGDEGGFSLIELIVVVVILGILAAVAIPIFLNIQQQARNSAVAAATANAATQITAAMAQNPALAPGAVSTTNITADFNPPLTFTVAGTAGNIDSVCVTSNGGGASVVATSGPGC